MKTKTETISERIWNGSQSWNYERIEKRPGITYKISIRRNAYDDQSYLSGYLFDGQKWHLIVAAPMIEDYISHAISYVDKEDDDLREALTKDAATIETELLHIAR